MTDIRKFTMQFLRRYTVGSVCFFFGVKGAKVNTPVVEIDHREPSAALAFGPLPNSLQPIITPPRPARPVSVVLAWGGRSEIVPFVVRWVTVFVVNLRGICSGHKPVYDAMSQKWIACQRYRSVPNGVDASRFFVCVTNIPSGLVFPTLEVMERSFPPRQNACFRVIIKALAQIHLIWQSLGSHLGLSLDPVWSEATAARQRAVVSYYICMAP